MKKQSARSDEPTGKDSLGRKAYPRALSEMALTCETPLVIGIHGKCTQESL